MNKFKWGVLVLGMTTLVVGLNLQAFTMFGLSAKYYLWLASLFYTVGAAILVMPPLIERFWAVDEGEKRFAELLIVLEIFLVFSGILFFWNGNLSGKIFVRIAASLSVTAFLKYGLQVLPDFKWNCFFNPIRAFKYHLDCLKGRLSAPYSLSLGIDWLGVGYAFLSTRFGKIALVIGSLYLFVAALLGFKASKAPIALAWTILNGIYVVYGIYFVVGSSI